MNNLIRVACALAAAGMAASAAASPIDFHGYFRSGSGSSDQGGKELCFRLPGSAVWFRLGNECDTYASLTLASTLGQVDGTTFRAQFTTTYGTQQLANWEQTTPAFREAFVEARDIGAAMGVAGLKGATLWAGKRFYKNPDIHMLDYTYWEPAQSPGWGLDNVDVGIGKLSYAWLRAGQADWASEKNVGQYQPGIVEGGARAATSHDLRLQDIAVNPGGKLTVGVNLVVKDNRDDAALADGGNDGRNGFGLTATHTQENVFGLGGFNTVIAQYTRNATALKGFAIVASNDSRTEWMLADQWVIEPKGSSLTASMTAGLRQSEVNGSKTRDLWVGARPQYHLNNVWSLMSEVGYQQVKPDGQDTRTLAKLTAGTQFSMGSSIWSRPAIRFYGTYAKWNDAAAAAGGVACTGRDCGTPVSTYGNKRSGLGYGVQVEAWW